MKKIWGFVIVFLLILFVISSIFAAVISMFVGDDVKAEGNVAVISISGIILPNSNAPLGMEGVSSEDIVAFIEEADSDPGIEAILFKINSGGGTPVASQEIADAIKLTDKPTVAWVREVGASGAYWIASSIFT